MTIGSIASVIAIVLVTIIIGVLLDRRFGILPSPKKLAAAERKPPPAATHYAGEAPATAIRVRAGQLAKLGVQRCATCRAEMRGEPDDHVRYDDRELLVLHFACPACPAKRTLYVDVRGIG